MSKTYAVGDTFTHVRECDKYRPIYYAAASGDFNPIHIDDQVGKAAGLGGAILQGLCTLGWAVEGFVDYLGDPTRVSKVKVRFSKPVAIADTITITGKVTREVEGKCVRGDLTAKVGGKKWFHVNVLGNCNAPSTPSYTPPTYNAPTYRRPGPTATVTVTKTMWCKGDPTCWPSQGK